MSDHNRGPSLEHASMHASSPPCRFTAPVISRLRCRHRAGPRIARAAWRRLRCNASLLDTLAAVNAEALARKEGSEQVDSKTGIAPLSSIPVTVAEAKAATCAKPRNWPRGSTSSGPSTEVARGSKSPLPCARRFSTTKPMGHSCG